MSCLRSRTRLIGLGLALLLSCANDVTAQTREDLDDYIKDHGFVPFRPIAANHNRQVGVIAKKGKKGVVEIKNTTCLAGLRESVQPVTSGAFSPERIEIGKGIGRWKLNYSWPTTISVEIPLSNPSNTLVAYLFVADEQKYEIVEEDFVRFVNDPLFSSDCKKQLLGKKHFITTIVVEGRLGISYFEVVPIGEGRGFDEKPVSIQEVPAVASRNWTIDGNKVVMVQPLKLAYYPKRAKRESVSGGVAMPAEGGGLGSIDLGGKRELILALDVKEEDVWNLLILEWPD